MVIGTKALTYLLMCVLIKDNLNKSLKTSCRPSTLSLSTESDTFSSAVLAVWVHHLRGDTCYCGITELSTHERLLVLSCLFPSSPPFNVTFIKRSTFPVQLQAAVNTKSKILLK